MNIWIFNHYAITPELSGGTRHFDLGREWVKQGHSVTVFASSFHHAKRKELKLSKGEDYRVENYEGVRFVWIKTLPYQKNNWKRIVNMLSYFLKAEKLARKIAQDNPDAIIGSSVHLFAVYTAYRLSKHFKTLFIMEIRDIWPKTLINLGVKRWHPFIILLAMLERFLYKKADRIITLLPKAHNHIESFGIPRNKITWIPNGTNLDIFKKGEQTSKKTKEFIIMYTGTFGLVDNLEVAVKSAYLIPDHLPIRFIFVGDGPEKNKLMKMVESSQLSNVDFDPSVPKYQISRVLRNADAFLLFSKDLPLYDYGLSPNKLFDYMATGKPVIFSSNSIYNPVMEAKSGMTIKPDDSQALSEGIIELYNTPEEDRKIMGERGRKYVEKYHNIEKLANKFLEVI